MASIPDSLIFEFLIRLPVKSLARFKCINRFWCSSISDQNFIYTHLKQAKEVNGSCYVLSCVLHDNNSSGSTIYFFTIKDYNEPAVLEYSAQVSFDSYHVLPSCNGLICFYGAHGGIHVCNPSTKKIVKIPYCTNYAMGSRLLSCGFGFDQQTCTYKIIRILEPYRSKQISIADDLKIEVLTMGTKSWRIVKYNARFRFLNRQPPVFATGLFYWITADHSSYGSSGFSIVSFDIGSETFGLIDPPESVSSKDWRKFCLVELGGVLCLVDMDFELEGNKRTDIWLLKEVPYGNDKKFRWVQETIAHPSEALDATRPVTLRGNEILLHGFIRGLDSLNWYNFETRRFRGLDIKGIFSPYFHISDHVESFVPLNG